MSSKCDLHRTEALATCTSRPGHIRLAAGRTLAVPRKSGKLRELGEENRGRAAPAPHNSSCIRGAMPAETPVRRKRSGDWGHHRTRAQLAAGGKCRQPVLRIHRCSRDLCRVPAASVALRAFARRTRTTTTRAVMRTAPPPAAVPAITAIPGPGRSSRGAAATTTATPSGQAG